MTLTNKKAVYETSDTEQDKHKELTWAETCSKCKSCCSDWEISGDRSEVVCGYNSIKLIKNDIIPAEKIKGLLVYEVNEKDLDNYAIGLRMFPLTNLLRHMTLPHENRKYYFLAIQPGKMGKCPFLTDNGCSMLDFKTYICDVFPFYVHKLLFHTDYDCPFVDSLDDNNIAYREKIGKYLVDYILEAEKNKDNYRRDLDEIIQKYQLKINSPIIYEY